MHHQSHDIIIIGAGIVGLSLAAALAQRTSLSIALLEANHPSSPWSAETDHHRVSAIALSSKRIFQSLQIWEQISNKRVSPFTGIDVWDAAAKGEITFSSQDIAESVLGYIIENNLMQAALEEKVRTYPHIKFIAPIKLTRMQYHDSHIELVGADQHFQAKLAIAADGANSWLRDQVGIRVTKHDYEQHAMVATVKTSLPHARIARQVFLPTGPLAFLPLAEPHTSSIVWSLPINAANRYLHMPPADFQQALAQAFAQRLGDVTAVAERFTFPLHKQQAAYYVKPRIALVGDAAHTVHPLAGQGVNMGLLDAASLVDVIKEAHQSGRDYAALHTLRRYERWRKADNFAMFAGVDMLKGLFASEQKSLQTLRSAGLNLTNHLGFVKNMFTKHAVGARGGLPEMAL